MTERELINLSSDELVSFAEFIQHKIESVLKQENVAVAEPAVKKLFSELEHISRCVMAKLDAMFDEQPIDINSWQVETAEAIFDVISRVRNSLGVSVSLDATYEEFKRTEKEESNFDVAGIMQGLLDANAIPEPFLNEVRAILTRLEADQLVNTEGGSDGILDADERSLGERVLNDLFRLTKIYNIITGGTN